MGTYGQTPKGPPRAAAPAFNGAVSKTASELVIRERTAKAVERLRARHEANEAALVAARFKSLFQADRMDRAFKPAPAFSGLKEDKRGWAMKIARYEVARDFKNRIARVNKVAERMIDKVRGRTREGLER
jgi:hypothetical protein